MMCAENIFKLHYKLNTSLGGLGGGGWGEGEGTQSEAILYHEKT